MVYGSPGWSTKVNRLGIALLDDSKLVLTINRQPIGEWFKEQFGKLGHGFRKTPDEPRKGGGMKL